MERINTLLELLRNYKIEIPRLQRDYVQGKKETVREILLRDLKGAILGQSKVDLNFIYGKTESGKERIVGQFYPVDGQQRLTTLFLLHVYVFALDPGMDEILSQFSYETRTSSRDFFSALVQNRAALFDRETSPSLLIQDAAWYFDSWKYDPTIQASLIMLDAIQKNFRDVSRDILVTELSKRGEDAPITFIFTKMESLGREDSLYIKLNARGRGLTPYENVKAQLIDQLKKIKRSDDVWLKILKEFESKFDGSWTDFFWKNSYIEDNLSNETVDILTFKYPPFDTLFFKFFGLLFKNANLILDAENNVWLDKFDFSKLDAEIYIAIFRTLDFLCANAGHLAVKLVLTAIKTGAQLPDRIMFHAVTTFIAAEETVDLDTFAVWLRVVSNLAFNWHVETKSYNKIISAVSHLCQYRTNLLSNIALIGDKIIEGFSQEQIEEERIKAQILLNGDEAVKDVIYHAETHPYFKGQIRAGLHYSNVKTMNDVGNFDAALFSQTWGKISILFGEKGPVNPQIGIMLRQALLTYGDYTVPVADYKTLCIDDPGEVSGRDATSLKRLFSSTRVVSEPVIRNLLDNLDVNSAIEPQLQKIIDGSTVPCKDWRYCFITYPQLFKVPSAAYMRLYRRSTHHGVEMLIVKNQIRSGVNPGIYLEALQIELKANKITYETNKDAGTDVDRFISIGGIVAGVFVPKLKVRYRNDAFVIETIQDGTTYSEPTDSNDAFQNVITYLKSQL